jgi:hypothetical protein
VCGMRRADDPEWCVLQMPQLWGNQRLFLVLRTAITPPVWRGEARHGRGKKIEDCASTAVLNELDVREGSQGNIRPLVYSFRHSSPRCFSPHFSPHPSRTPMLQWVSFMPTGPLAGYERGTLAQEAAGGSQYGPYFGAGAGAVIPGAGADVAGAGAGFEVAWEGAVVAGAGAIELCTAAG